MKKLLLLLLSLVFTFGFISCDDGEDLPEIPEDTYIGEDGGIHLPPVDYIPNP